MAKTTSSSRKMRRIRDVAATNENPLSGFELYGLQGDPTMALEAFNMEVEEANAAVSAEPARRRDTTSGTSTQSTTSASSAKIYNRLLLRHLQKYDDPQQKEKASTGELLKQIDGFESSYFGKVDQHLSARKRKRNHLILGYNRALILYARGQTPDSIRLCAEKIRDMVASQQKPTEEALAKVASRLAMLLLEGLLSLSLAGPPSRELLEQYKCPPVDSVISWLEHLASDEKDPQLKFLVALYKSRVDLAQRTPNEGKHSEANIRSAKKELKTAMEVFQQKLRTSFGADTASVVSSANSEQEMSSSYAAEQQQPHQPQQPTGSVVLQKHNQAALNLKASLEQLKGNVKKSLILCSEAHGAVALPPSSSSPARTPGGGANHINYYEAIHANNLGVVYETTNKRHLAVHALGKSLSAASQRQPVFQPDGTAAPNVSLAVVYNTGLAALATRQYLAAYECLAACLASSVSSSSLRFGSSARCWLRLAEACLGIHHDIQETKTLNEYAAIEVNNEPKGLVLLQPPTVQVEGLNMEMGSHGDLAQVQRQPLLRARYALERTLACSSADGSVIKSAKVALSFVCLSFKEYARALELARGVLEDAGFPLPASTEERADKSVGSRAAKRGLAAARLYAAEACCALGLAADAMKFLAGSGKDDAFDRLASDLGGINFETAANYAQGKRRLARASAMVRSSASAATASMGNITAAKQWAMSAQAMEDAAHTESNRERSSARRALIYCLLRDGNSSAALSLLQSLRNK